jgi:hypothetical protein
MDFIGLVISITFDVNVQHFIALQGRDITAVQPDQFAGVFLSLHLRMSMHLSRPRIGNIAPILYLQSIWRIENVVLQNHSL